MKNFRKLLSAVLATVIVFSAMPFMAVSADAQVSIESLIDFPAQDHWSYAAMKEGIEGGIIYGYEDNTVRPKGLLTRAEMCAVITRAFGAERMAYIEGKFSDVESDDWFYTDIAKAIKMRIAEGQGGGIMNPNATITRQDAIVILARALVLEKDDTTSIDVFYDNNLVADYARGYIAAFLGRGYIHGYEDGSLRPVNSISREEFAQIMANIFSMYVRDNGAITLGEVEGEVMLTGDEVYLHNTVVNGDLIIGDGVGSTNVTMENVTVNGRIVFRGGEDRRVYFVNTQRTDLLVVNDYNGTINFYHYSDEPFFKDGVYNTPVTFLDRSVPGGTASGKGLGEHDTKVIGKIDAGTGVKIEGGDTPGLPIGPVYPGTPGVPGGSVSSSAIVKFHPSRDSDSIYDVAVNFGSKISADHIEIANDKEEVQREHINIEGDPLHRTQEQKIIGDWYYLDPDTNKYKKFDDTVVIKRSITDNGKLNVYYMFSYVNILLNLSDTFGAIGGTNTSFDGAILSYEVPFDSTVASPITHLDALYLNQEEIALTINAFTEVLKNSGFTIAGIGNDDGMVQGVENPKFYLISHDDVVNNIEYKYRLYNLLEGDTVEEYTAKAVANYFPTNETLIRQSIIRALDEYNAGELLTAKLDKFLDTYNSSISGIVTTAHVDDIKDMIVNNIRDYKETGKEAYTEFYDELLGEAEKIYHNLIKEFMTNASTKDFYYVNKSTVVENNRELIRQAIIDKLSQEEITDVQQSIVDEVYDQLPEVVKAFFTKELITSIIKANIDSYKHLLENAKNEVGYIDPQSPADPASGYVEDDGVAIPSHVKVVINPVEHIIKPSLEKITGWTDEMKALIAPESLFNITTDADQKIYSVKTGEEYADILYRLAYLMHKEGVVFSQTDIENNNNKLNDIKDAIFTNGAGEEADFSLFTGLLGAFSFTNLGKTTYERLIAETDGEKNIVKSYDAFIKAVEESSGFKITDDTRIEINEDGTNIKISNGNVEKVIAVKEDKRFVDFAKIIKNIGAIVGESLTLEVKNTDENLAEYPENEASKKLYTLSDYRLNIKNNKVTDDTPDYISFKVILK